MPCPCEWNPYKPWENAPPDRKDQIPVTQRLRVEIAERTGGRPSKGSVTPPKKTIQEISRPGIEFGFRTGKQAFRQGSHEPLADHISKVLRDREQSMVQVGSDHSFKQVVRKEQPIVLSNSPVPGRVLNLVREKESPLNLLNSPLTSHVSKLMAAKGLSMDPADSPPPIQQFGRLTEKQVPTSLLNLPRPDFRYGFHVGKETSHITRQDPSTGSLPLSKLLAETGSPPPPYWPALRQLSQQSTKIEQGINLLNAPLASHLSKLIAEKGVSTSTVGPLPSDQQRKHQTEKQHPITLLDSPPRGRPVRAHVKAGQSSHLEHNRPPIVYVPVQRNKASWEVLETHPLSFRIQRGKETVRWASNPLSAQFQQKESTEVASVSGPSKEPSSKREREFNEVKKQPVTTQFGKSKSSNLAAAEAPHAGEQGEHSFVKDEQQEAEPPKHYKPRVKKGPLMTGKSAPPVSSLAVDKYEHQIEAQNLEKGRNNDLARGGIRTIGMMRPGPDDSQGSINQPALKKPKILDERLTQTKDVGQSLVKGKSVKNEKQSSQHFVKGPNQSQRGRFAGVGSCQYTSSSRRELRCFFGVRICSYRTDICHYEFESCPCDIEQPLGFWQLAPDKYDGSRTVRKRDTSLVACKKSRDGNGVCLNSHGHSVAAEFFSLHNPADKNDSIHNVQSSSIAGQAKECPKEVQEGISRQDEGYEDNGASRAKRDDKTQANGAKNDKSNQTDEEEMKHIEEKRDSMPIGTCQSRGGKIQLIGCYYLMRNCSFEVENECMRKRKGEKCRCDYIPQGLPEEIKAFLTEMHSNTKKTGPSKAVIPLPFLQGTCQDRKHNGNFRCFYLRVWKCSIAYNRECQREMDDCYCDHIPLGLPKDINFHLAKTHRVKAMSISGGPGFLEPARIQHKGVSMKEDQAYHVSAEVQTGLKDEISTVGSPKRSTYGRFNQHAPGESIQALIQETQDHPREGQGPPQKARIEDIVREPQNQGGGVSLQSKGRKKPTPKKNRWG